MPVSGVIISFASDERVARHALAALAREPRIELGAPAGSRYPATIDTDDTEEDRRLWQWLHALPGVVHVDVVFVHFDPAPPSAAAQTAVSRGGTVQEVATP